MTSRAVAVQARTLEFYRQVGLADTVIAGGREVSAANLWVSGRQVARAVFGPMGGGISPYPYAFIFPQDEHERLLIDRLSDAGVEVERETEFVGLEERDGGIIARLQCAGGRLDFCEAVYRTIRTSGLRLKGVEVDQRPECSGSGDRCTQLVDT